MVEYSKVNAKLSYSQLNKLKTAVENQKGAILRMNIDFMLVQVGLLCIVKVLKILILTVLELIGHVLK